MEPSDADLGTEVESGVEVDWQRVHPLTVLFELAKAVRQALLAFVIVAGGDLFNSAIEGLLILGPFGAAVARWYTTRYAVDREAVRLEYGLLWRSKQVLPRDQIQNVSSSSNLLARAFGLVEVKVSEASLGGEIEIRYVEKVEGERLAVALRTMSAPGAGVPPATDGSIPPTPDPDALAAAPAPVVNAADADLAPALVAPPFADVVKVQLARRGIGGLVSLGVIVASAVGALIARRSGADLELGVLGSILGVAVLLVGTVGAGVAQILNLADFHLWDEPDRLRIRTGLLTEKRQVLRRERVQALRVDHHRFLRWIGREQIQFGTADIEFGDVTVATTLSPASPWGTWPRLARTVFGTVDLDEDHLLRVSRRTIRRVLLRWVALGAGEAVVVGGVLFGFEAGRWTLLALVPLVVAIVGGTLHAPARWRRLGYAIDDRHLLVRLGVIAERLHLIDLDKIQIVRTEASFFQRRLGLASVSVTTAGRTAAGSVTIPDLPAADAQALAARLIERSAATPLERTI